jgi:gluconolactonase
MNLHQVTAGLRFPEGPIAMQDGSVVLVEIERRTLIRVQPDGTQTLIAQLGGGPNGAAIGPGGICYICNNGGFKWTDDETGLRPILQAEDYSGGRIECVDLVTGAITTLYTQSDQAPLRGPNDLVFDRHGGFYFTDLGKARHREIDRGCVCYARADGSHIREICFPMLTPNGIGLSPDGATLYVAETEPGRLWAFDLVGPGEIRRQPWPSPHGGRLVIGSANFQRFDSLAVDRAGNICVATLVHGGISVIAPDGSSIRHVPMPERWVTNICFGGPDMRTAFITLSSTGRLVSCRWHEAGAPLAYLND